LLNKPILPISMNYDSQVATSKVFSKWKKKALESETQIFKNLITYGIISHDFVRLERQVAGLFTKGLAST